MAEAAVADTGAVDTKVANDTATADATKVDTSKSTAADAGKKTALAGDDTKQVADSTTKTDTQIKVEAKWADDWRDRMAAGNEKLAKRLGRYASPEAVASGLETLLTRMEAGEFKKPLAKDATEDEIKAYRTANGIPETADKYEMPDGLQISDIDKPIIEKFTQFAHEKNWTPETVKGAVNWFYEAQAEQAEQAFEADRHFHDENVGVLKAEWGQEYNRNINGLKSFVIKESSEEMYNAIFGARLGDGTLAGDNANFLKFMAKMMMEVNPAATLTTGGGVSPLTDIAAEKAKIEKLMRDDRKEYDRDPKNAQRYLELVEAEEKIKQRAA